MKKIPLADTGQLVSELCLGTMYFGTGLDQMQSEVLLDQYIESGGNFIDTANNYAFWKEGGTGDESETVIGQWLQRQSRDKLVIATKCGARPTHYQGDLESVRLEGLGYETIMRSVEDSLRRLKTDYIDVLYAHVDFMDSPVEERLIAFTKLKEQGKIRFSGISNVEAWRVQQSQQLSQDHNYLPYSCIQQKYSYLRPKRSTDLWLQRMLNEELLHYSYFNKGTTLLAYSTLLSGLYNKKFQQFPRDYRTTDNSLRLALLQSLAEAKGCSLNQLVLAWMMHHQVRIIPIISGSQASQIEENMAATQIVLNEHEMNLLNKAGE
jgi:aryl-alcohol dehydrogenase-like predicted oxidoreductase